MAYRIDPFKAVDSYKLGHRPAYPDGTTEIYSNFTPRSGKHLNQFLPEGISNDEIVWIGGQSTIKDMVEMWDDEFFDYALTEEKLQNYVNRFAPFAGSNYSVEHIKDLHELGYLPLEIKTLDEGTLVPYGVPVLTVRNTHPEFFWLTNYIESYLSSELWKMSTAATVAFKYKEIAVKYYEMTGSNFDVLPFAFHDFSYRGLSGSYDAAKTGLGHLLNFIGSDNILSADYAAYHYEGDKTFLAASVPAMEHSIQTAYKDDYEYFRHIIKDVYPSGIVSVVADGYDYWNVLENVIPKLKEDILSRPVNELGLSKVVIRPDSGDPADIICGVNKEGATTSETKGSIEVLWDIFGGTVNEKGYKTLDPHIGLIYGDSITPQRADDIMKRLEKKGFSADNVVFGIGSYTYQRQTRDTLGFAMKATNAVINGEDVEIFKDPKTDIYKTKKSAKGLLKVAKQGNIYLLADQVTRKQEAEGELTVLFKDGKFFKSDTFEELRERLDRC